MSEKAQANAKVGAGLIGGNRDAEGIDAPKFVADFECVRPGEGVVWREHWNNAVVQEGKHFIIARVFGRSRTDNTGGVVMALHACTTTHTQSNWANLSGSQVTGYATAIPGITFSTAMGNNTDAATYSVTTQYGFTAGTNTSAVSGAAVLLFSSTNMGTSVPGGTNNTQGLLYSIGNFGSPRTITTGDSLNVTLTVSFA